MTIHVPFNQAGYERAPLTSVKPAPRYQHAGDILTHDPEWAGRYQVPQFIHDLVQRIQQSIPVQGAFLFGGAIADALSARTPKDYDLYICSPQAVKSYQIALDEGGYEEDGTPLERSLGYNFPTSIDGDISVTQKTSDVLGDYIEFTSAYYASGVRHTIDLKIGSVPVDPANFLSYISAPITCVAVDLMPGGTCYSHKDFPSDLSQGIMRLSRAPRPDDLEKSRRKGLRIITPSDNSALLRPFNLGGE